MMSTYNFKSFVLIDSFMSNAFFKFLLYSEGEHKNFIVRNGSVNFLQLFDANYLSSFSANSFLDIVPTLVPYS